jgi:hypothetical protein
VYTFQTPGKRQSRIEDRDSGAEGVLDGGILPPFPSITEKRSGSKKST